MDDELWPSYVFWSIILILKMMNFTWWTGRLRVAKQVIHSEADRMFMKGPKVILDTTGGGHPDIDRIRAAHRSDVEIVVPFLLMSLIWLETSPSLYSAKLILTSFAGARILHGLVHMEIIPHVPQIIKTLTSVLSYSIVIHVTVSCLIYCM